MEEILKYIVYITINLRNGKMYVGVHLTNPNVFDGYIGCGVSRKGDAKKDYPFHKAVRKHGYENFKRTTIAEFPYTEAGRSSAYALEAEIVTQTFIKSKTVYNVKVGGLSSVPEEDYKKVYMFGTNGNYLRSFKSVRKAAEFINNGDVCSTLKAIRNCCLGITSSSYGYVWSYKKEFSYENKKKRKVAQYTISGKFLKYYDSITSAELELSINCIHQAIVKKTSAGGFQWRYYDDNSSDIEPLMNYYTKYTKLPIIMYNDSESHEYESVKQCVEQNPNLKSTQINRVLKNIIKTHMGWKFKFKGEDIV